jgi:hypothetical protein
MKNRTCKSAAIAAGTTPSRTAKVRGKLKLKLEVDFRYGSTTCRHVSAPEALLIDERDRCYLVALANDPNRDLRAGRERHWVLLDGMRWKRLEHILEGDLSPVTLPAALLWYAEHQEAYDSSIGAPNRLCKLAATALSPHQSR